MSNPNNKEVKPLVFRTLEGEPVVPSWLRHGSQRVQPAPFTKGYVDEREPEPFPQPPSNQQFAYEALPEAPQEAPEDSEPPPPPPPRRRTSLPPRLSAAPPPVTITRPPPAPRAAEPVAPPAPAITPAEQQAFALAALELGSLRARLLSGTEAQLLELAVSIAEVLIEREVEKHPEIHSAFARAAVAALGDTRAAKLRVSRAAYKAITQIHGEEAVEVDGVRVELTLDNSLEGLSVVAESGMSRVDGRVRERLATMLRAIEADHRRQGAEDEA